MKKDNRRVLMVEKVSEEGSEPETQENQAFPKSRVVVLNCQGIFNPLRSLLSWVRLVHSPESLVQPPVLVSSLPPFVHSGYVRALILMVHSFTLLPF